MAVGGLDHHGGALIASGVAVGPFPIGPDGALIQRRIPDTQFELMLQEPTLAAAVINYGHLLADATSLKKINAAVLGIFGAQDRGIPVDDVKKFEQTLKQQGNKVEVVIYPDAGHAFENPNNHTGYRAEDAADAWKHTVSFLAGTLKK